VTQGPVTQDPGLQRPAIQAPAVREPSVEAGPVTPGPGNSLGLPGGKPGASAVERRAGRRFNESMSGGGSSVAPRNRGGGRGFGGEGLPSGVGTAGPVGPSASPGPIPQGPSTPLVQPSAPPAQIERGRPRQEMSRPREFAAPSARPNAGRGRNFSPGSPMQVAPPSTEQSSPQLPAQSHDRWGGTQLRRSWRLCCRESLWNRWRQRRSHGKRSGSCGRGFGRRRDARHGRHEWRYEELRRRPQWRRWRRWWRRWPWTLGWWPWRPWRWKRWI